MKEQLIIIRNIFYKCFFIGVFFLILAFLLYMPCKCIVPNIYQIEFGISAETYSNLWVGFLGLIKTILVFLFLTPAIALHWATFEYSKKIKLIADIKLKELEKGTEEDE